MLKAKQHALNEAIAETKKKLEMEKEAAESAKEALKNGDITQSEYDALQAEIVTTTDKLKDLEKQARQSASVMGSVMQSVGEDIKKVGDNIQAAGEKVQAVGESATKNLTVPIVAAGTTAVYAFKEVDKGLDIIVKKTGATGEALENMKDIAKNIAQDIPTDFEEAGAAVGEVNTRFNLTGKALEDLSTEFIKFSKLNDTDVSNSIDSVQKVMSAYNVDVKDATKLLDTLNATGQKTGISMDTLTSLMVTNSASLQQMGFNASSAAEFLGSVEMSGADTSQVMSGLTKALKNATDQGIPLNEALASIQKSMVNAENETAGLQYAYELFGTKAGAAVYEACKNGSLSFDELSASMESNAGNIDKTYDTMLDGTDKMKTACNSAKIAVGEVGETISESLAPMIERVAVKIRQLGQGWKNLSAGQQQTILKVVALIAVLGPAISIIAKVIGVIAGLTTGIGTLVTNIGTAVTFIKGSMIPTIASVVPNILPVIAVIAGIVAAIAAVIAIIKNWETITAAFKEFFTAVFQSIADFFKGIGESIATTATHAWEGIQYAFASVGTWFTEKFQQAWNGITGIFNKLGGFFQGVWNDITAIFKTIGTTIADAITGSVKSAVNTVLSGAVNIINGFIGAINFAISAINAIPGVKIKKLSQLNVPQLELGGILKKGQVGLLEGNGAEAVVPLDKNKAWVEAVAKDFRDDLDIQRDTTSASQQTLQPFAGDIIIPVSIGGSKFTEAVVKANQINNFRSGGR
ncbi:MAG: phage tail tape measure protein [Clostridium sp.]|nr:phage tail tape measure protein [Clostridium sp.]